MVVSTFCRKPRESLLRGPASHGCVAIVLHGLSQTARLVEILDRSIWISRSWVPPSSSMSEHAHLAPWFHAFTVRRVQMGAVCVGRTRFPLCIVDTRGEAWHMTSLYRGIEFHDVKMHNLLR